MIDKLTKDTRQALDKQHQARNQEILRCEADIRVNRLRVQHIRKGCSHKRHVQVVVPVERDGGVPTATPVCLVGLVCLGCGERRVVQPQNIDEDDYAGVVTEAVYNAWWAATMNDDQWDERWV